MDASIYWLFLRDKEYALKGLDDWVYFAGNVKFKSIYLSISLRLCMEAILLDLSKVQILTILLNMFSKKVFFCSFFLHYLSHRVFKQDSLAPLETYPPSANFTYLHTSTNIQNFQFKSPLLLEQSWYFKIVLDLGYSKGRKKQPMLQLHSSNQFWRKIINHLINRQWYSWDSPRYNGSAKYLFFVFSFCSSLWHMLLFLILLLLTFLPPSQYPSPHNCVSPYSGGLEGVRRSKVVPMSL